jgi:hypothetical protein
MIAPEGREVKASTGGDVTSTTATDPVEATNGSTARGRRRLSLSRRRAAPEPAPAPVTEDVAVVLDIAPNDPAIAYFQSAPGAVELSSLALESPALDAMRAAGVVLVVPLVTSGELVGLLQLGPRLSERGYSKDDRQLLDTLARYAAPALRLGQLVRSGSSSASSRRRPGHASGSSRSSGSRRSSSSSSFRRRCPSCRRGTSRRSTARRGRWAATSTTSSSCPTAA